MLDAAREAVNFAATHERVDLDRNHLLALGLVKVIAIIGEAAARVSEDARQTLPDVPWSQIVGMRNRLVHGYFDVDLDRVWDTIVDDLPSLISSLEQITGL